MRDGRTGEGRRLALGEVGFAVAIAALVFCAIVLTAVVTGALYHAIAYGTLGPISSCATIGVLVATLYLLQVFSRDRMQPDELLRRRVRELGPELTAWCLSFMALLVIAFLSKTSAIHSRGWLLSFFTFGFALLPALSLAGRRLVSWLMQRGRLQPRRVVVVGFGAQVTRAIVRLEARGLGTRVVGVAEIEDLAGRPLDDRLEEWRAGLARTTAAARRLDADDIVIAVPLSEDRLIDMAIEAFSLLPVGVEIDAAQLHEQFGDFQFTRVGRLPCLAIIPRPMQPFNAVAKRLFDLAVASVAIVLLAPVMAVVAVLIRLDSASPVLFVQRRLGFNQQEFRIFKFRTMTTMDDGDVVVQASRRDPRVTRVGRWLRRTNLDELPQLFNVLRGEMSIVGPRPHALAHDRHYEQRIGTYPRRLNVKPGITGWAQINGFRGETDTEDKMVRRIEHDLFYIENWSLGLDLYIVAMTFLSRRTFKNAY